jgi:hypothetical protein
MLRQLSVAARNGLDTGLGITNKGVRNVDKEASTQEAKLRLCAAGAGGATAAKTCFCADELRPSKT